MTGPQIALHIGAAIVLMGIVTRLFELRACHACLHSRMARHVRATAYVLIALGMLARLFRMEPLPAYFITAGLVLVMGIPWRRRSEDR